MTRAASAARALSFDFFFPLAKSKATALPAAILKFSKETCRSCRSYRMFGT